MDCFQITLLLVYRILNSNNIQWNSIAEWLDVPMCDVILHPSPCKEKQLLVVGIETNFLTIWWGDEVHNLIRIISSILTQYCTIDCQAIYQHYKYYYSLFYFSLSSIPEGRNQNQQQRKRIHHIKVMALLSNGVFLIKRFFIYPLAPNA